MAMSQSHSTVSSIAFLISPSLRLWKVFWRVRSPEMRSILTGAGGISLVLVVSLVCCDELERYVAFLRLGRDVRCGRRGLGFMLSKGLGSYGDHLYQDKTDG
eukprot:579876-Rhodomonas_salina.1